MKQKAQCVVLTGGPSVGKSTLIAAMEGLGQQVGYEAAAQIILEGVFHPCKDRLAFQQAVLARQQEHETVIGGGSELWYLDRGLLDGAAYCQLHEHNVPDMFWQADVSHYLVALVLEPLDGFVHDGIRPAFEDLDYTRQITPLFDDFYRLRGVPTVRVPAMSVAERISFIEAQVKARVWL